MTKETPTSDGFIICMRENSKHMVKLPRIPQRNRKIRDNKKACYPKERNDEENNQQDHHRFLPAFTTRVTAAALLEHQRNEALGAMHVFNVRLADGLAERPFLNAYPVHMARHHAHKQDDQAGPVCHRETYPQHGQERTAVARMANTAD